MFPTIFPPVFALIAPDVFSFLLFLATLLFQLLPVPATIILQLLPLMPAIIPDLFPAFMAGPEVTSAVVIPVIAVDAILLVTVGADLLDTMLADTRWQLAIGDLDPGAVVVARTMPTVAIVQIVEIRAEDDIVGCIDPDIEPQPGRRKKVRFHFKKDRRRTRDNHSGG
jgi:hypothetical protein